VACFRIRRPASGEATNGRHWIDGGTVRGTHRGDMGGKNAEGASVHASPDRDTDPISRLSDFRPDRQCIENRSKGPSCHAEQSADRRVPIGCGKEPRNPPGSSISSAGAGRCSSGGHCGRRPARSAVRQFRGVAVSPQLHRAEEIQLETLAPANQAGGGGRHLGPRRGLATRVSRTATVGSAFAQIAARHRRDAGKVQQSRRRSFVAGEAVQCA